MGDPLSGRRVVLGVGGGLAACEAPGLCSRLVQAGAEVDVVLSEEAGRFVEALTFQALTHRRVYTSLFELPEGENIPHISLADCADLVVIAPADPTVIGKLANGLADDLACAIALATPAPILIVAGADAALWRHPATQRNVRDLESWGARVVPPPAEPAEGGMADLEQVVEAARSALASGRGALVEA